MENNSENTQKNPEDQILEDFLAATDPSINTEESEEFKKWYDDFMLLSDDEKKKLLLEKAKEQLSDNDKEIIDKIVKLIESNSDKHTDIIWLQEELEKEYKDITPLAIMNYFLILSMCGILTLDNQ